MTHPDANSVHPNAANADAGFGDDMSDGSTSGRVKQRRRAGCQTDLSGYVVAHRHERRPGID